ncbi:putative type I fatty acid synthase, partial [Toxoplasma gondii FOU]
SVRFREAVVAAFGGAVAGLSAVEVGPKRTLANIGAAYVNGATHPGCAWLCVIEGPATSESGSQFESFLKQVASLSSRKLHWNHRTFPLARLQEQKTEDAGQNLRSMAKPSPHSQPSIWSEKWAYHSSVPENDAVFKVPKKAWIIVGVPSQHMAEVLLSLKRMGLDTSRVCGLGAISSMETLQNLVQGGTWAGMLVVSGLWATVSAVESLTETAHILRHYACLSTEIEVPVLAVVTRGAQRSVVSPETFGQRERPTLESVPQQNQVFGHLEDEVPVHAGLLAFCRTLRLEMGRCCRRFKPFLYFDTDRLHPRQSKESLDYHLGAVLKWLSRNDVPASFSEQIRPDSDTLREWDIVIRKQSYFVPRVAPVLLKQPSTTAAGRIQKAKSYIVTGGLGGIGIVVASWLLRQGAGRIFLWSRRGVPTDDVKETNQWCELNAAMETGRIQTVSCDVSEIEQVRHSIVLAVTDSILGGIFHCAGTEGKGKLQDVSQQDIADVNALQEALKIKLPASLLVEYACLKDIIQFIMENCFSDAARSTSDLVPLVTREPAANDQGFAVVGMGCRIPKNATTTEEFWDMLLHEIDAVCEIPMDRFNIDAFYDPDPEQDKCYTREAALLDHPDFFDNTFFNLSDQEVLAIDPQQRVLLEVAYEALFEAGFTKEALLGKDFGVFCAAYNNDFQFTNLTQGKATMCVFDKGEGRGRIPSLGEAAGYPEPGGFMCFIPNRISYSFGLTGPSIGIDAACASSLVAFDAAVTKLKRGACSGALVGGVNIILSPTFFLGGCKAHQFSRAGRCKTFDCNADGLVRGEGCGAAFLLPLDAARETGAFVHAVVRGSATCHYGRSSQITSPNTRALTRVLRLSLQDASTAPSLVRYYEAHGTATVLGDVIEMSAVKDVFQTGRNAAAPLHMGTVHNNIGHLDAAAGIVAFLKTVLCLKHRFVPANIHFKSLHPDIHGIDTQLIKYTRESHSIMTDDVATGVRKTIFGANLAYGMGGSVAAIITESGDEEADRRSLKAAPRHVWNHRRFPLNTQKFVYLMGAMGQISMDDMPTPQSDVIHVMKRLSATALNVAFMRKLSPSTCAAGSIRSVFLTGATGFIGSQVLFHLLQVKRQDPKLGTEDKKLTIYCLVRARDRAHGIYRIRDSLVGRGIEWKHEFDQQVIPVIGNLEEGENMGLGPKQMQYLEQTVDAVYHAADYVNFAAPYDALRKSNVLSLIPILKLCTTYVAKPLHLVSNFAHHLQYFAGFSEDLNIAVDETVSPPLSPASIDRLEQQMPAGIIGYPWTKWAVEEIIGRMKDVLHERCEEEGQRVSMEESEKNDILSKFQVTVYRLPNSCVYYNNGYTNFANASLSLVLASAQERMIPPGVLPVGAPFLTTPVDLITGILVKLSMTEGKRHHVYHLVSLRVARRKHVVQAIKWLFPDSVECTADELFRRIDENKENSPAHPLRAAMRFWRRYWYSSDTDRDSPFPVAVNNVEDDLPGVMATFPSLADTWLRMASYCVKNYHMVRHPFTLAISFERLKKAIAGITKQRIDELALPSQTQELLNETCSTEDTTDIAAVKALVEHANLRKYDDCAVSDVPDPRARA